MKPLLTISDALLEPHRICRPWPRLIRQNRGLRAAVLVTETRHSQVRSISYVVPQRASRRGQRSDVYPNGAADRVSSLRPVPDPGLTSFPSRSISSMRTTTDGRHACGWHPLAPASIETPRQDSRLQNNHEIGVCADSGGDAGFEPARVLTPNTISNSNSACSQRSLASHPRRSTRRPQHGREPRTCRTETETERTVARRLAALLG
jgi:hypothetical protein